MQRIAVSAVSLLLLFLAGCNRPAETLQDIVMGPYVNHVTENEARILWVSRPGTATHAELMHVAEGSTVVELTSAPITRRTEMLHTAKLSGLKPGHSYVYKVDCGRDRVVGKLHTALPRNTAESFRFIVYGDTRSHPERHRMVVARMKKDLPVAFVVHTGDLVENGMVWDDWTRDFFTPTRDLFSHTTIWPVRGNHERDGVWYRALFDLPGNELYYSFDYGNLHVVMLDCYLNPEDRNSADPEMLRWLEADLASCDAEWIMVGYHNPTFNIGGHASKWGQEDVLPILEKYGVDLVVNGHSHIYERFRPIGPAGGKPIIHIVSGGGGAPTYPVRPSPILTASESELHHCLFTIRGNRLDMVTRTPEGKVIDQMTLVKANGTFQDEVLADAVATADAVDGAFLNAARLWADFAEVPQPGQFTPVDLSAIDRLPEGCHIRISQASSNLWVIQSSEFTYTTNAPCRIMVQAPDSLVASPGKIDPPLELSITVDFEGRTYHDERRGVRLSDNTIRKLTPEPIPVPVFHAAEPIAVDGQLDDWQDIPPIHLPSTGTGSAGVRLAWRAEGLHIAAEVEDDTVSGAPGKAWKNDGLELFIEADYGRSIDARKNPHAFKCSIVPLSEYGGVAHVDMDYGTFAGRPDVIQAAWRRTSGGYTLELLIASEALSPADMAPGTKIGFHYALWDAGEIGEQFIDPAGKPGVWRTALYWGAIELTDTPEK